LSYAPSPWIPSFWWPDIFWEQVIATEQYTSIRIYLMGFLLLFHVNGGYGLGLERPPWKRWNLVGKQDLVLPLGGGACLAPTGFQGWMFPRPAEPRQKASDRLRSPRVVSTLRLLSYILSSWLNLVDY
jgi:hypothetical protein